ncbi:ABC transporter ATP-binding protein/permease, partial [Patescibacteria group bacterium]|nr:ABC transporter ATP-binding protein/permease [Patescibacteria group bacterium]
MQKEKKTIRYKEIFRMIWPSTRSMWRYLPVFFIFASVLAVFAVSEPYIYGSIIDSVIGSVEAESPVKSAFQLIFPFLIVWAGIVIFETTLSAVYMYCTWIFGNKILGSFLQRWYEKTLNLDIELFRSEKSGELLRKFDNIWDAIWMVNYHFARTFLEAGTRFCAALVIGLYLDWRLTLVALVPVPAAMLVGLLNMKTAGNHQHGVNKYWEKITGHVSDSFSNIATVKSFSGESRSVKRFASLYLTSLKHQLQVNRLWACVEAGYGAIYTSGRLFIFAAGAWLVLSGSTSLGTLIMFLGFANFLFGSVQQIMSVLPNISKSLVNLDRSVDYWTMVPKIKEKPNAKKLKRVSGKVEFKNVSFSYVKQSSVLKNVSFIVPDGKVCAIVGESGAGKSTLAQMMLRYHDPDGGSILIDEKNIKDLTLNSLRSNVGFVMQENLLFHDSILNNIRLARPSASLKQVESAAKKAQANDFISRLPGKYKSIVGERGVKLSGGEKQRIALARVFLEDPPILVLDEATSALDSKTEHE